MIRFNIASLAYPINIDACMKTTLTSTEIPNQPNPKPTKSKINHKSNREKSRSIHDQMYQIKTCATKPGTTEITRPTDQDPQIAGTGFTNLNRQFPIPGCFFSISNAVVAILTLWNRTQISPVTYPSSRHSMKSLQFDLYRTRRSSVFSVLRRLHTTRNRLYPCSEMRRCRSAGMG